MSLQVLSDERRLKNWNQSEKEFISGIDPLPFLQQMMKRCEIRACSLKDKLSLLDDLQDDLELTSPSYAKLETTIAQIRALYHSVRGERLLYENIYFLSKYKPFINGTKKLRTAFVKQIHLREDEGKLSHFSLASQFFSEILYK